jgi:predicted NUDIX family NTP pyrophosphohydrolase
MIPKGGIEPGESAEEAARREFLEELGAPLTAELVPLCRIRQTGGKWVEAFACEGDSSPNASSATSSRWNGRPAAAGASAYQRWMRLSGTGWTRRGRRMLPSQLPILEAAGFMSSYSKYPSLPGMQEMNAPKPEEPTVSSASDRFISRPSRASSQK